MPNKISVLRHWLAIFLLAALAHTTVHAQTRKKVQKDSARHCILIGKYFGSAVLLRWAPKTTAAWMKGNSAGYQLFRFEYDKNSQPLLSHPVSLTTEPIRPLTLTQWKAQFQPEDTAAGIAAQVLYGKWTDSASPGPKTGFSWQDMYSQHSEEDIRLGMALLNADMHPSVAAGMGWRWEDKTVENNKTYYYVLISPATLLAPADTTGVLVSASTRYRLPKMVPVVAMPWDQTVTLYWNRALAVQQFTCYYIERSDDRGKTYSRVNQAAYVSSANTKEAKDWMSYTDSIPQNYHPYLYRLRGITAYGELSAPSDPVTASGLDKTGPGSPVNVKAENIGGSKVRISWQRNHATGDLAGFLVGRSNSPNGPFLPLDTVLLRVSAQNFIDKQAVPWDKNFYIVAALDTAGNASRSIPVYAAIRDTLPPAMPTGLSGSIDSAGIVRLHWHWNRELDLAGYNVYASNDPSHPFYILNRKYVTDSLFRDTISLKTLTRRIYYRVCAFDKTGNPSPYSAILPLTKPDIVPPVAPEFTGFRVTDSSVMLHWVLSSSEDAARQVLWRKTKGSKSWTQWKEFPKDTASYTDRKVERLQEYDYSLTTIDSSGLSSPYCFPLHARIYDDGRRKGVDSLQVGPDRDHGLRMHWVYRRAAGQPVHFLLYRDYNGKGWEMIRKVDGDQDTYTDPALPGGGTYRYAVKVITDDGGASLLFVSSSIQYDRRTASAKTN